MAGQILSVRDGPATTDPTLPKVREKVNYNEKAK
jgi:hypothetical protein